MQHEEGFEKLQVWKEAVRIAVDIYPICKSMIGAKDFAYADQLKRSTFSISSNIAEGYERNNNKEFARFLGYAKGSAGEARSQLYIAFQLGYIPEETYLKFRSDLISLSKQIKGFIKYLRDWNNNRQNT